MHVILACQIKEKLPQKALMNFLLIAESPKLNLTVKFFIRHFYYIE